MSIMNFKLAIMILWILNLHTKLNRTILYPDTQTGRGVYFYLVESQPAILMFLTC